MPTLKTPKSTVTRNGGGGAVLAAARSVDTRPIKAKLDAFRGAHTAFLKADAAVAAAEEKLSAAQRKSGEADAAQDVCVESLATSLIGSGQPRTQPFKGLSPYAPSDLKGLGHAAEAKAVRALVTAVRKRKGNSPAVLKDCNAAEKAAAAMDAALKPVAALAKDAKDARTTRDALVPGWEKSFAALKIAARGADGDNGTKVFATLFGTTAPVKKAVKKKGGAAGGASAPGENK